LMVCIRDTPLVCDPYSQNLASIKKWSCLAAHHISARGERSYSTYSFLTLVLDGGDAVSITPRLCLTPRGRTSSTHYTGGCVNLRASLKREAKGEILCSCHRLSPSHPVHGQTLYWVSFLATLSTVPYLK
jgi:hypothetical protein